MSSEQNGAPVAQPASFAFTAENLAKAQAHIAKYPPGRQASAVLPLLDLAQRQSNNWLPRAAMDTVAKMLDMAPIRVYEVATFYFDVQFAAGRASFLPDLHDDAVLAARLRGGRRDLQGQARHRYRTRQTADGQFSLIEVECLGGCVNAPVIQVNDDFDQVAERLRRQLTQVVAAAGIAADAATWLKEVGEGTVRVLTARGSATGAELAPDEPRLRTQIIAAADNPYGGAVNLTTRRPHVAVRRRADRARPPARRVDIHAVHLVAARNERT